MTRIVAVGKFTGSGNNTIAYSDNSGVSWTPAQYNGGPTRNLFEGDRGFDVLYNSSFDLWIAGGKSNTYPIAYSTDGANWKTEGISWTTNKLSDVRGIACNGSRWVAVGEGSHSIAWSDDGYTWNGVTGKTIFSLYGLGVDSIGDRWVAIGANSNASPGYRMAYSNDGKTWFDVNKIGGGGSNDIFKSDGFRGDVTAYGSLFVAGSEPITAGGNGNTLAYSYDGINWTLLIRPTGVDINRNYVWRIATNGTRWIAVGRGFTNGPRIVYSDNPTDINSWIPISNNFGVNWIGRGICWAGGDVWIATAVSGSNRIVRSIDNGLTWTGVENINSIFNDNVIGVGSGPSPPPPVPYFATGVSMPTKIGVSDSQSSFRLGRMAILKNIADSHKSINMGKNVDYTSIQGLKSSNVFGKPINNNGAGLRTQRLRLTATGIGSLKVNTENEQVTLGKADNNVVTSARNRVRGSGGGAPKR